MEAQQIVISKKQENKKIILNIQDSYLEFSKITISKKLENKKDWPYLASVVMPTVV